MDQGAILIVDDNEMNRDMLSRRLRRLGYEVELAENGWDALEMLRKNTKFNLVLLDVMMPRMNGYEVLQTIKQDAELHHLPVIMISAVDDLDSVVQCIEMGAEDYLFKPFNPVLLKARVESSIRRGREAALPDQLRGMLDDLSNAVEQLVGHVDNAHLLDDVRVQLKTVQDRLA